MTTVFLRALEADDKQAALLHAILSPEVAQGRERFEIDLTGLQCIPGTPFAYWVSDKIRAAFSTLEPLQCERRVAAIGASTKDDGRFVRAWWEGNSRDHSFPFAKGGAFSPYYSDVYLVLRWKNNGREAKVFVSDYRASRGWSPHWKAELHNPDLYFRPGLTWPRRTKSKLSFRVMPSGCIFGDKGPEAFVKNDDQQILLALLAIVTSSAFWTFVEVQLAAADAKAGGAAHSFEVGVIQRTPVPTMTPGEASTLAALARRAWSLKRTLDSVEETSHAFLLPASLRRRLGDFDPFAMIAELEGIQSEIDGRAFAHYGLDGDDLTEIENWLRRTAPDVASVPVESSNDNEGEVGEAVETDEGREEGRFPLNGASFEAPLVSWAIGVAFGRFDVRLATGERGPPPEPDPFDPLPLCSSAMLTGETGLPLETPPAGYPIDFPSHGILADDPGDRADITGRVRAVFGCVFGAAADRFLAEAAQILGNGDGDLRPWLNRSLFEDTIRRYSKSRRKAPIYWQLATPAGSYSVWLYYHRLTKDTFYTVFSDHIDPKLQHEERRLGALLGDGGDSPNAGQRRQIAEQEAIVEELRAFREEVARIAPLWNPNHDDGVIINFAPLWRLVPQHRAWQRECKACWGKLVAGDYDWSHLAMHLWPERVVPKCADDRSLAIAHGLEEVFWFEDADGKWKKREVPARPVEELVRERTSPAVKAALKSLLEAPAVSGGSRRGRRRAAR